MWFSVIVDSGWFELFAPTRLPLAPLVLEAEGAIFTCLERVAHVRIVDCTRPGPLGNPFPVGDDQDVAVVCAACDELMLSGGAAAATPLRIDESYLPDTADERREALLCDLASYIARLRHLSRQSPKRHRSSFPPVAWNSFPAARSLASPHRPS